jgi:hypothetical protein
MDLLSQRIDVVEGLVVDLDLPQKKTMEIATDNMWGICCNIVGSTIINTLHGRILPILGFAKGLGETHAITTSGGQSWMHEYMQGVMDGHSGR